MPAPVIFPTEQTVVFQGPVQLNGGISPPRPRTDLASELLVHPIDLGRLRKSTDFAANLAATAASTDLGLVGGSFGTDVPSVQTGDVKALGTVTRSLRFQLTLPPEYVAGQALQLRLSAGMKGATAGTSASLDVEAYKSARTSVVTGGDLVTTAAVDINSTTFAEKTFTINPTSLLPGEVLDCKVSITTVDPAGVSPVIGTIGAIDALITIKG